MAEEIIAKPPLVARALSVAIMLFSVPFFVLSTLFFISSSSVYQTFDTLAGGVLSGVLILIGVLIFVFALLYFVVGLGLWHGKEWARITIVVVSAALLVLSLAGLLAGNIPSVIALAINIFFSVYFVRGSVKQAYH